MELAELDVALNRLRESVERVGANLVALEQDATWHLLEATSLCGITAERWKNARTQLTQLFDDFARLTSLVERATELRSLPSRAPADLATQLASLLYGPVIDVSVEQIALSKRDLFDPSTKVVRETAEQVLARMTASFRFVNECISTVGRVWDDLVPRLAGLREELEAAASRASDVGPGWDDELHAARSSLDGVGNDVLTDPLAVSADQLDDIANRVRSVGEQIEQANQLRVELTARLSTATEALARLDTDAAAAASVWHEAATKVASPSIPPLPRVGTQLGDQLKLVRVYAERRQWRAASDGLAAWWNEQRRVAAQLQAAAKGAESALARRRELRGRLDAYCAKASGLGLSEDLELSRLHDAAQHALYIAPADLEHADDLVREYQHAIATPRAERKTPM